MPPRIQGAPLAHTSRNLPLAFQQLDILDTALATECAAGCILGPYNNPPLPNLRCSGLSLTLKHDGGWRTIYCLSAPSNRSINDFIDADAYTLSYCTVDHAFAIVNQLGRGALMAKIDLKNVFRLLPIRQEDWHLLGIHWKEKYFIDTCLPFGLFSAPCLFDLFATALHWMLQHRFEVCHLLHYLDDFFTAGTPQSCECSGNLAAMLSLCQHLNIPVKTSKVEGPTTRLTFLGIVIDTSTMQASISMERKLDLLTDLKNLHSLPQCTNHLLSLVGKLSFACKVIPARWIFLG